MSATIIDKFKKILFPTLWLGCFVLNFYISSAWNTTYVSIEYEAAMMVKEYIPYVYYYYLIKIIIVLIIFLLGEWIIHYIQLKTKTYFSILLISTLVIVGVCFKYSFQALKIANFFIACYLFILLQSIVDSMKR